MLNFPILKQTEKNTFSISAFEGLDRRVEAGEKTLSHTKNISVSALPILSTRNGRKKLFTPEAGEKITGIFIFDKAYMTTSYGGRTRLYCGDSFASMSRVFTSNADELVTSMLCVYDGCITLFNLKNGSETDNTIHTPIGSISTVSRRSCPNFTDITVFAGRIFGCSRNRIRACAYRDISVWSPGEEGADPERDAYTKIFELKSHFTACTTYKNRAIFFTADEMYELYGNSPLQFKLVKVADVGCISRFAISQVDGKLFFVSKDGVMKYTGTTPVLISDALCDIPSLKNGQYEASLCSAGKTLYISYGGSEQNSLYSYNTELGFFAREDELLGVCAAGVDGKAFIASQDGLWQLDVDREKDRESNDGADFEWEIVTQDIHHYCAAKKRSASLNFYLIQKERAAVKVYCAYDGGEFELVGAVLPKSRGAVCIPLENRDFESIRIKICGRGQAQIHYLSRIFSLGGRVK